MREAILAALRRDPELVPKIADSLKERIGDQSRAATVVQAAGALEPVLEDAVRKRPSRLGLLGLKSAHILAGLALEDESSNRLLNATIRSPHGAGGGSLPRPGVQRSRNW